MMKILKTAAALAVFLSSAALAQETHDAMAVAQERALDLGPAIGSQAPTDWSLPDQTGTARTLADISGPSGTVIFFNRSLDWCPFCQNQTIELEMMYEAFVERGYGVAVLTYEPVETNARFAAEHASRVVLLADEGSVVIRQFDILDPVYIGRSGRFDGLPYPVAFALSPTGEVKAKFWHEPGFGEDRGYRIRVSTEDVLTSLDALNVE